jgi:hypothetical protein
MAYVKPGVEISQIQSSVTPVLISPDLEAVVVGPGYYWQDPTLDSSEYSEEYDGTELTISLSGFNASYYETQYTNDNDLVLVDIYVTSGTYAGYKYQYSANMDADIACTEGVVTIASGLMLPSEFLGTTSDQAVDKAKVRIGYRSLRDDLNDFRNVERTSDVRAQIGEIVSWNPLAYGTYLAQLNAGTSINIYGVTSTGTPSASDWQAALNELEPHEVYGISWLENKHNKDEALVTHVEAQSEATNKHERIAFVSNQIDAQDENDYRGSDVDKNAISTEIKNNNFALGSKRLFSIHPDVAYVSETRHINTLYISWIEKSFSSFTNVDFSNVSAYAKLVSSVTLSDGTKYWPGDDLTDTVVTALKNDGVAELTALVPVPGFYYSAVVAGQVAGQDPSQPLTNMPTAGLYKTYGSQDYFSEANLNTMAEGGTYIMNQTTPTSSIMSRHQMSTDVSSIAYRELSVTKALDFVSKFIRNGLRPYIGKYTITPAFLRMLNSILVGMGRWLVREGHINDLKVLNVTQDAVNPDTILVEINVLVKYPVNYIKIQLIF